MRSGVLLFCSSLLLCAQDSAPTADKGVLSGKVLNSVTGEPIRKAHVTLMSLGGEQKGKAEFSDGGSPDTDAAGSFEFTGLAPGSYALAASRDGFTMPAVRASKLPRVMLASGEEKRDIVIRLMPLGAIAGRILDEDGDPIRRVEVQVMVWQYTAAGRQLARRGSSMTDDAGEYRIYDLPPGRYYVKAGSPESMGGLPAEELYAAWYYPGTADPTAASTIEVGAGQTRQGINLTLRPTKAANIRGRVVPPGNNLMVGLMKDGGGSSMAVNDPDGIFELQGVSPGSYILTAAGSVGGQNYRARLPIQVGADDLGGIELHLMPPMEIAGQIRIEGKTSAKLSGLSVDLQSEADSVSGTGTACVTKEDGSFVIGGLDPAVYHASALLPGDLYLKAVRWLGRDVMQCGIDLTEGAAESKLVVVLSANGGQIDGVVSDDRSAPVVEAMVTLVPAGGTPSKSLFKFAWTSTQGHFHMQGIAPGSYKLFAWEDVDTNQVMYDPDFLKPFDAQAQSIEISEGSKESVQLKLIKQ